MKEYVIRVSIPQTYTVKANSEEEAIAAIRNSLQPNLQSAAQFTIVTESIFDEETQTFYIPEEKE